MALSDDDIREILRIVDESELAELRIDTEGFSLHVLKGGSGGALAQPPAATRPSSAPPEPPTAPPQSNGAVTIDAPMLGTFYRAQEPGAPPFVEPGADVEPDTIVCIIEVMKMMNSIPAGVSGVVTDVLAENADLVEYGAPLFRVKPR
ncbi:MAG TPA: acetyl-CoA carboxylase biotin carboxyl carrier protein [Solirubrobacteraceae bacterium]|nr:acetyl-CoA carboxylase biotin carboxyl carrier protein [Solirubrobacteraceae bacterium]